MNKFNKLQPHSKLPAMGQRYHFAFWISRPRSNKRISGQNGCCPATLRSERNERKKSSNIHHVTFWSRNQRRCPRAGSRRKNYICIKMCVQYAAPKGAGTHREYINLWILKPHRPLAGPNRGEVLERLTGRVASSTEWNVHLNWVYSVKCAVWPVIPVLWFWVDVNSVIFNIWFFHQRLWMLDNTWSLIFVSSSTPKHAI